jgi:hypothetical protein
VNQHYYPPNLPIAEGSKSVKGVSKLGFHPTGWPQKSLGGFGVFVAAKSLQPTNQKMALGVKRSDTFSGRLSSFFFSCHLSKASGPLPLQSPINRTFSDRRIAASLKAGLDAWKER